VRDRLGGMEPTPTPRDNPWKTSREAQSFPEFYQKALASAAVQPGMACTSPVTYRGQADLKTDLDNLRAALNGVNVAEAFVPSISPANIEDWNKNLHYKSDQEYLFALADAMNVEYRAIVDAGFLLQIDDPRLVSYFMVSPKASIEECRRWAIPRVEALNHALRDIPREKVRYHTCYGINMGPRTNDMEIKHLIDIVLTIKAGAFSFEASNPRHEHEWTVWRDAKKPEGTILIPGVITHSSVLVEHPELVAERIVRYANAVGRENVIAGSDCGFATFAGSDEIHPRIVWAKFEALVQGAEMASKQLWGR
jgi:5-methyltetrahydropteroyltriglutamate--homocysteine methyltransferase